MGIKDWFTREVEKLSLMIAALTGLLKKGEYPLALEKINDYYNEWLGLGSVELDALDPESFINTVSAKKLKRPYLEALEETLVYQSETLEAIGDKIGAIACLEKAIAMLRHITIYYKEYSFERENRIKNLERQIETLGLV